MNQSKCVFCSRSDVDLILLGSGRTCSSCLAIGNHLVNVESFFPDNKNEEAVLALIFFLETDLVLTRQLLNNQYFSDEIQILLSSKIEKLAAIKVDYSGIEEHYIKKVKNMIKEHLVLLDLYTDFT